MVEVPAGKSIREANNEIAQKNAERFTQDKVFVLNLMSSPGAGKTSLLEATLRALKDKFKLAVIEGDLQTSKDAERIACLGVPVYQINTHGGCHLDARMINLALSQFDLPDIDILFIENVGNLVCPASFFLGEHRKVVLLSIPEGSDKPAKYPKMFRTADLVLFNKMDIIQYCDFDDQVAEDDLRSIRADLSLIRISCRDGNGLDHWYSWLESEYRKHFK